jgi:hypothetical protein
MEVLYACFCGIEVHAKMLVACLLKAGKKEVRTFSTMTEELLHLLDWLSQAGCTHVAIESTGVWIASRRAVFPPSPAFWGSWQRATTHHVRSFS